MHLSFAWTVSAHNMKISLVNVVKNGDKKQNFHFSRQYIKIVESKFDLVDHPVYQILGEICVKCIKKRLCIIVISGLDDIFNFASSNHFIGLLIHNHFSCLFHSSVRDFSVSLTVVNPLGLFYYYTRTAGSLLFITPCPLLYHTTWPTLLYERIFKILHKNEDFENWIDIWTVSQDSYTNWK